VPTELDVVLNYGRFLDGDIYLMPTGLTLMSQRLIE